LYLASLNNFIEAFFLTNPFASFLIGNPPFTALNGSKSNLRSENGNEY